MYIHSFFAGKEEGEREGQVEGTPRGLGRRGGRGAREETTEPVLLRREGDADHEQRHEGKQTRWKRIAQHADAFSFVAIVHFRFLSKRAKMSRRSRRPGPTSRTR